MNTAHRIYENVKTLPEPILQEVLDFIEFMRQKAANRPSGPMDRSAERSEWPEIILDFMGEPDFPPFEAARNEWIEPPEDPYHDLTPF